MFEFPAFLLPTNLGQPLYIQPISPDCRNFFLDPVCLYWRELTCLLTDHDSRFLLLRNCLSTNPHTEQRPSFWNRVCRRRRWNGTYLHGRDFYDMKLGRWGLPGNCAHLYAFSQVTWTTLLVSTRISRTKLHDWAVWQATARCYSQAALSSNDSKTLYCDTSLAVSATGQWAV